jgi:hypothetical protein
MCISRGRGRFFDVFSIRDMARHISRALPCLPSPTTPLLGSNFLELCMWPQMAVGSSHIICGFPSGTAIDRDLFFVSVCSMMYVDGPEER